MKIITTSLAILTIVASVAAQGAVVYSEFTDGELSGFGLNPTPITLALGSNEILGRMGGSSGGADRDYFVVTVPTSVNLTTLKILPGTQVLGDSIKPVSFIGVQAGSQVTLDPRTASANGLLGWSHYGAGDIDTDILPAISKGFGASGFTIPLGPGNYAFWLQETGSGTVTYGFDLQLQAVPLPGALVSFAAALAVLRTRRRSALTGH
jgi:hypothetical protein